MVQPDSPQMTIIRSMRFACWVTKATDTHSEYIIIIAFPRQQCLRERASMLCLYVHCLSCYFPRVQSMALHWIIGVTPTAIGICTYCALIIVLVTMQPPQAVFSSCRYIGATLHFPASKSNKVMCYNVEVS
jgi:hypothetical protein